MGFLMRRNDRGIVSGGIMLHDLVRNWFPDLTDVLWKDLLPDSRMHIKVKDDSVCVCSSRLPDVNHRILMLSLPEPF